MSIFESPTAVQPRADEAAAEDTSPSRGFDPRSVQIAAVVTAALVVLGLLVSNAAKPDSAPRPALASKVGPGAAAVEEADNAPAPVVQSSAPANVDDDEAAAADESTSGESDASIWQEPQPVTSDTESSGDSKWDRHPGKGHGHWR
jgi:hypothetical protein